MGLKLVAAVLTEEVLWTAAIEGESLNRDSVRSSVARRLGLATAGLPPIERHVDGLVEMLIDATTHYERPLTAERLFGWQAALFPTGHSGMRAIEVGGWRTSLDPMQVVSGPMGNERVHYEAPPSDSVAAEMARFFEWWQRPAQLDGLVRAGLAHLFFVTIHPFDDGNGRLARAITDMALAQDERNGARLYSMSAQINAERSDYYAALGSAQKGNCDVTEWLVWFLGCLSRSIQRSEDEVHRAQADSRFWQRHTGTDLSQRQRKVILRLLEAGPGGFVGSLTNRKYVGMTRVSRETAKRDLADLVLKRILRQNPGGGRSVSYDLIW